MKSEYTLKNRILSFLAPEDFIGRNGEIEAVLQHAQETEGNKGLLVFSAPGVGISELLRQAYDRLFFEQGDIIPIYFSFSKNDRSSQSVARRFLQTFLLQVVAFRREDASLLNSSPDVCELVELAAPADIQWIDRLVSVCKQDSYLKDERAFIKQTFSAPLRANGSGTRTVLLIDDFHYVENIKGDINLLDEIKEIYSRSTVPFVFAGRRRYVMNALHNTAKSEQAHTLRLNNLSISDAGLLVENLATKVEVKITEQTRDLIVQQFQGNPTLTTAIIKSAKNSNRNLDSFQSVERLYADALLGGAIGNYYDSLFNETTPNLEVQKKILRLLANDSQKLPVEAWRKRLNLSEAEFYRIIKLLNTHEIIRFSSNAIEKSSENKVLSDYLESRYHLEAVGEQRALVVGTLLSESLKEASNIMARFYRRSSSVGLRDVLSVFNCQEVPASLLDYSVFKEKHKGEQEDEILAVIESEAEKISLPQIVYTANCAAFYPPIKQFSEDERAAVAIGFDKANYTDDSEVVWIAAEVDSKMEASKETAEFWCDRLEMVALMCNFLNYKLWLITPEGFLPEALEVLRARNAYGSSRQQINLLIKNLKADHLLKKSSPSNEYEIIVPMGDDTEMIAAHTVEEIARRHEFPQRAINQMKTALVEACINATEHSLSPDRRIYQKFTVENDKIVITISNRGLKIPSEKVAESTIQIEPENGRRGWGLKLMRTLMDEVKFEQVDDGTRISMTKYLKK